MGTKSEGTSMSCKAKLCADQNAMVPAQTADDTTSIIAYSVKLRVFVVSKK